MNPTHSELIDALNLLCEYAEEHLPKDYTITAEFTREEQTLELTDRDGEVIESYPDALLSAFAQMCTDARGDEEDVIQGD